MKKILMFAMLLLAGVALAADKYDKWLNEEVKPILTKAEKDEFKKMKSDADKDKFIADFWARRDPSPGTPENEYKKNYDEQLQILTEKLKGGKKKPVDSDMGMTALIMGGGQEVKVEETKEGDPPRQTWVYKHLPPGMAEGDVEIAFVGDPSEGGFKFADSKKAHAALDVAREYYARLSEKASNMKAEEKAKMDASMAAAEAMPTLSSPAVKAALDGVAGGTIPTGVEIHVLADSFMSSKGETFATYAAHSPADVASARIGVRILNADGSLLKEGEYAYTAAGELPGYFQGGTPIKPGEYTLLYGVVAGDKTGGAKKALSVPDYTTAFGMSSLILSKNFKQLPEAATEKEPYTFGKIKVEPNVQAVFTKADEVIVVYEAYNFEMPAGAAAPALEVVFTFQRDTDAPKSTPPSAPNGLVTGKKITIPTSYPLAKFPPGNYKLTVKLTDKTSSKTATREATFVVK